jgi:hypothetical protein
MTIHHLSEHQARSSRAKTASWKVALPLMAGLSAMGWMVSIAVFLELRRLLGL